MTMIEPDEREATYAAVDPWTTPERISLRDLAMSFTRKEIVPTSKHGRRPVSCPAICTAAQPPWACWASVSRKRSAAPG